MALARTAVASALRAVRGEAVAHHGAASHVTAVPAELAKKQGGPWGLLTLDEKKQLYRLAFKKTRVEIGKGDNDTGKVLTYTIGLSALGVVAFFAINMLADPVPKTMSKEYKDAERERQIEKKMNPINGYASKHL